MLSSRFRVMMFNATFNNILVISWRSVVLVEEIRVPVENHRPVANHNPANIKNNACDKQDVSRVCIFPRIDN
jgi:hypothetical protein